MGIQLPIQREPALAEPAAQWVRQTRKQTDSIQRGGWATHRAQSLASDGDVRQEAALVSSPPLCWSLYLPFTRITPPAFPRQRPSLVCVSGVGRAGARAQPLLKQSEAGLPSGLAMAVALQERPGLTRNPWSKGQGWGGRAKSWADRRPEQARRCRMLAENPGVWGGRETEISPDGLVYTQALALGNGQKGRGSLSYTLQRTGQSPHASPASRSRTPIHLVHCGLQGMKGY